jgi:hypothetical protein
MPVDTVRAIVERPNLVDSFRFRPSAATTLRARLKAHDAAIGRVGKQIASGDAVGPLLSALDQEQRASALDIAYEYNTYHRVRNRGEDSKERETAFEILKQRSQLPVRPALRVETPAVRPDQGHSTALTSIGFGRVQDKNVSELQFRPALHALSDRPEGYLLGNQIKFMDTTLQWGEEEGVRLHRITAVDIAALTPRDEFFSPVSWRVNVNGARFRARDGDQPFAYSLNGGAGHTYALGESMIVYGMVESDLTVARDFSDNFFLSLGASAGLVYHLGQGFGLEAKAQVLPSLWGETITQRTLSVSPRISLGRNDAIRFDGSVHEAYGRSTWSSIVRFEHFFSPW